MPGSAESSLFGVSRETVDRLRIFVDLFERWSSRINLVAASSRDDIWQRHIADSLQLGILRPEPCHWIDLGSGGGFPGLITAIALAEHGSGWVDLVESNRKKASFLRQALRVTGGRGSVHADRIEDVAERIGDVDCISARALTDLSGLFTLAEPWLGGGKTVAYFHKGRDYRREVAEARRGWEFVVLEHASKTNPESVVLEVSALRRST